MNIAAKPALISEIFSLKLEDSCSRYQQRQYQLAQLKIGNIQGKYLATQLVLAGLCSYQLITITLLQASQLLLSSTIYISTIYVCIQLHSQYQCTSSYLASGYLSYYILHSYVQLYQLDTSRKVGITTIQHIGIQYSMYIYIASYIYIHNILLCTMHLCILSK